MKVATWNAAGLPGREEELFLFMHENAIDICMILEAYLTTTSASSFTNLARSRGFNGARLHF